jgi:tripartite-type tricarboxylate transporter receptor subunit TctC
MRVKVKDNSLAGRVIFSSLLILTFIFPTLGYPQEEEIAKFPTRPITFVIPLPPGGNSELAFRLIIKLAEKHIGQPIVPINKPGAGLTIGVAEIAKAKPDGYTIGLSAHGPMLTVPFLRKVPYHPVKDFIQIMQFASFNLGIVVRSDSTFKNLKDVIAYARQNPKKLTFGSVAIGLNVATMKRIGQIEKVEITPMPFGSAGEAEIALLGGHIDMVAGDFRPSFIEEGKTRLLVLFREERSEEYPETPTLKELGYDIPAPTYMGVQGPKGIPEGIVKKIEEAFTKAMKEPAFIKGMKEDFFLPITYRNSKDLSDYVAHNYEVMKKFLEETVVIK